MVESRNAADELFGEQRLLAALEANRDPATVFDEIEQALLDFHGQPHDDLSLVEVVVSRDALPMPPTVSATAHRSRPMDWSIRVELRAESLRNGNPLPSLLQILLQVNQLRSRAGAIYTVLGELYSNALEHGVLGLDSSLKCDAEGFKRYYEQRQQRLQSLVDGHVHLELTIKTDSTGGRLRICIDDSGAGFDVKRRCKSSSAPIVSVAGAASGTPAERRIRLAVGWARAERGVRLAG